MKEVMNQMWYRDAVGNQNRHVQQQQEYAASSRQEMFVFMENEEVRSMCARPQRGEAGPAVHAPSFSNSRERRFRFPKASYWKEEYNISWIWLLFSLFVSTARRKMLFVRNAAKWKEEKTRQSVKSAAHEKTNNALSSRINNKKTVFGIKPFVQQDPLTVVRPAWSQKDSFNFFSLVYQVFRPSAWGR